jgi:REP element-mobilizing transposase RayT
MKGHSALRLGRASIENQVYLITFTTYRRAPLFSELSSSQILARCIESRGVTKNSEVLCWVIMPDHVHLLLRLGVGDTLGNFVMRLKSSSTRRLELPHPVWARAYHDRAIRREEDILPAARYIVANPLRSRLAKKVGDYPYWNSVWL